MGALWFNFDAEWKLALQSRGLWDWQLAYRTSLACSKGLHTQALQA